MAQWISLVIAREARGKDPGDRHTEEKLLYLVAQPCLRGASSSAHRKLKLRYRVLAAKKRWERLNLVREALFISPPRCLGISPVGLNEYLKQTAE